MRSRFHAFLLRTVVLNKYGDVLDHLALHAIKSRATARTDGAFVKSDSADRYRAR